jgi:ABC-type uncharacterized transport system substrate-binding protein
MNKPTTTQIEEQIRLLKEIKPNVKRFSFFQDDHHAAIDAQIRVLDRNMSEDAIDNYFEPSDDSANEASILSSAQEARNWLDGEYEDYPSLVDGWKELTK